MADVNVTEGKVVAGSALIPYIRRQDVAFDADNLRPGKTSYLFFDEVVMNGHAQRANKIVLNSKKILQISPNTGFSTSIYVDDLLYQGSSNASPTFSGIVETYYSGNTTIVIKNMSGNFDPTVNVFVENTATYTTTTQASINSFINANTSDVFARGEGVYSPNTNNHVYMTVLGTSGENILYVNENYISVNIGVIAPNTLSSMTSDYKVGDLIYQTDTGVRDISRAVFRGRVEYYNPAVGANSMVVTCLSGKLNVNTTLTNSVSRIWNSSNPSAKATVALGTYAYDFVTGDILISATDINKRVTIVSHEHNSGLISNVSANTIEGGGQYVYLNSSDTPLAAGNLMYITAGTGLGQFRRVTSVSGKRVTLASSLAVDPSSDTKYSIGNHMVDENGSLSGILNVPEEPNFKFKTGERIFTITDTTVLDSDDYTMKAASKFSSGGLINQMQRINMTPVSRPLPEFAPNNPVAPTPPTQRTTTTTPSFGLITSVRRSRVPRFPIGDPIAQTFFTPKPNDDDRVSYGVFVTSIDLFFGTKPSSARGSLQLPVSVKIAEVDNGYPTKNYLATATVKCKDVKVSTSPSATDANTITKFIFNDPVYLLPDAEYALIVQSESPEYECYIAELGGNVLGADPPQRISEQPYAGSFFRSQNSSTWTAYQNEDLMFVINKAVFSGTGSAVFNLKDIPQEDRNVDRLLLNAGRLTFPTGGLDFKVKGVFKSNSAFDTYNYIKPQQEFKYGSLLDASNKQSSANFLNTRKIEVGNSNSIQVLAEFSSTSPDISPIFNMESIMILAGEHNINNAGISNTIISIVNRGNGYNAIVSTGNAIRGSSNTTQNNVAQLFRETYLANNYNVGFYHLGVSGGEGIGAEGFVVANTTGSNTVDYVVITSEGSGYVETPSLTVAAGNATTGMIGAVAVAQGETSKRGGNIRSKYITRQITLEDGFESGDIRVYMDVVRPNGTDVQAYYKVLSAEDPERFADKPWVRMEKFKDNKSKDSNQTVELQFRPDLMENKLKYVENGQKYPIGGKFKHFAIKVALTSVDSTIVPLVRNLRIIATPEG